METTWKSSSSEGSGKLSPLLLSAAAANSGKRAAAAAAAAGREEAISGGYKHSGGDGVADADGGSTKSITIHSPCKDGIFASNPVQKKC